MVAAAIIGGAVVGAAGTAIAGNSAKKGTSGAARDALDAQKAALDQQAELSRPYRELGTSALQTYQNLLTGPGQGLSPADLEAQQKTLESLPGYQFTRDQGIENTARAAGAQGFNLSGQQLKGITDYTTGLADSTYAERLAQLLQPIQIGQAAAAGQAANIGTAATNQGNIAINQGNTLAGINANTIAGISGAFGNAANQYLTYNTLKGLNSPGSTAPAAPSAPSVPTYGEPTMPTAGPYP